MFELQDFIVFVLFDVNLFDIPKRQNNVSIQMKGLILAEEGWNTNRCM